MFWDDVIFLRFLVCSHELDIHCSGSPTTSNFYSHDFRPGGLSEMGLNVEYSECTTSFILVSAYEYSFGGFLFYPHFRVANKLTIDSRSDFLPMAFPVTISIPQNISGPSDGFIKHVEFHGADETNFSFTYEKLEKTLLFEYLTRNDTLCHEHVMTVTFKTPTVHFCVDVLKRGIFCERKQYRFLGYSESQMTEKTCFMMHMSEYGIHDLLSNFGDFYQITDPRLRARRCGLLFATFDNLLELSRDDVVVEPDVKSHFGRDIFTSGCGFMYPQFHAKLRSQLKGTRYPEPSAILVRYQGFEGMLVLKDGPQNFSHQVQLHESMQKFDIQEAIKNAITFMCVVDHSRPHENGYLDILLTMLLIDRGVLAEYIKSLQKDYYKLLKKMCKDKASADFFLRLTGRNCSVNRNLTTQLRQDEIDKMMDYVDDPEHEPPKLKRVPRTYILVPKSRMVFGVCDPHGELNYDECYFKPTLFNDESEEFANKSKVIVACIPCYHPGDIRVLTLTHDKSGYENLFDCLVLPVKGRHSHAFECGGSNLGGTKFFVSWDESLIPKENVKMGSYSPNTRISAKFCTIPPGSSHRKNVKVNQEEMIDHFATFVDNLPKRIDQTYKRFAKALGPSSDVCKQLSKMFYQATHLTVDATVLQKRLAEEFKHKDPARPGTSSGDQSPTERSGLLEEDGEETPEIYFTGITGRNNEGLEQGCLDQLLNRLCSCRRKPSSGPDYEALWNEFDEQTARFVEEMEQGQDFN